MNDAIKSLLEKEVKSRFPEYKIKFGLSDDEIKSLKRVLGDLR